MHVAWAQNLLEQSIFHSGYDPITGVYLSIYCKLQNKIADHNLEVQYQYINKVRKRCLSNIMQKMDYIKSGS